MFLISALFGLYPYTRGEAQVNRGDDQRVSPGIVQIQSAKRESYRGLRIGMAYDELSNAAAMVGILVKREAGLVTLVKDEKWLGMVMFGDDKRVERLALFPPFFDLEPSIDVRDFARALMQPYGVQTFEYEFQIDGTRTFYAYAGRTSGGDKMLVSLLADVQQSMVEIFKPKTGSF